MLEQCNNLQCEFGTMKQLTMRIWNNGTTYNANVGIMELTMRIWNNETTYNVNVGTMEQLTM